MEPPASPDPVAVADRQLDAYNRHDVEAFAACFADDVRVVRLPVGEILAERREGIRTLYGDLFRREPGRRVELLRRIACGNYVVDHERVTVAPGAPPKFAVAIYEVADGLIRRVWFPPVVTETPPA